MGFGAEVRTKKEKDLGQMFSQLLPEDLLKYGLIPEFIGRVPVIAALQPLDENALVNILTEPKNALTKQYETLFAMDNVELEFQPDALEAVAQKAVERQIGARGLRAVMEQIMVKIMYMIPSDLSIKKVIITPECVDGAEPVIIRDKDKPRAALHA